MKYKKALLLIEPGIKFRFFRAEYIGETFIKTDLRYNHTMCCIQVSTGAKYWFNRVKKVIPLK